MQEYYVVQYFHEGLKEWIDTLLFPTKEEAIAHKKFEMPKPNRDWDRKYRVIFRLEEVIES